jgi:hypothetical protein
MLNNNKKIKFDNYQKYFSKTSIMSEKYYKKLNYLQSFFSKKGYVELPNFFRKEVFDIIKKEVMNLQKHLIEHDFIMPQYETPRKLSTIGGTTIRRNSLILELLYSNNFILDFIKTIVGEEVFFCQHPEEWMVINILNKQHSTHGWHLDDPEYALVTIIEMRGVGGNVEIIDIDNLKRIVDTFDIENITKNASSISEVAKLHKLIYSKQYVSGQTYLIRAGKCLHRVSELVTQNGLRIALNMAFENTPQPSYGNSAHLLYQSSIKTNT